MLGICYYPEHWARERWQEDARQMRALGFDTVRIAEFAWALLEPAEGTFNWEWLDAAIQTLHEAGLQVILGTPTAAPPPWLTRAYPQTLPIDALGIARNAGGRRQYCVNSPEYAHHTRRIVSAMGTRYGHDARISGWQIDNEFGGGRTARCYCPNCQRAFRIWLQNRYGTLNALNEAWGSVFWGQIYSTWDEIEIPNVQRHYLSPPHTLDYYRFASDSFIAYQQLQRDTLLPLIDRPRQFVTHNFMGLFPDLNYHHLAAPLDFVTWDNYPTGNADRWRADLYGTPNSPAILNLCPDLGDPYITGMAHEFTLGLKQQKFWIMEQQPGYINWGNENPGIAPGAVRLWAWHALACGAEKIVFFRWRASVHAHEQYHAGLLRHDGQPDQGYREVQALKDQLQTLQAIAAQPLDTPPLALLINYDDWWALQIQPHRKHFHYLAQLFTFYRAAHTLGLPLHLVPHTADLTPYRMVIAAPHLGDDELAARLQTYAQNGGTVLLNVRAGFKTPCNQVETRPLPGAYRDLAGVTVTDWHSVPASAPYPLESEIPNLAGVASLWAEALEPESDVKILARYTNGALAQRAALTAKQLGQGRTLYLGWYPTLPQAQALLQHLADVLNLPRLSPVPLPEGVLAYQRGAYKIWLNFTVQAHTLNVGEKPIYIPARGIFVEEA